MRSANTTTALPVAARLDVEPRDARLFMIADKRWKYVHAVGFRPMLYDIETDPQEFRDLGADRGCEAERQRLAAALAQWGLRLSQRTTLSEAQVRAMRGRAQRRGVLIGVWDESDLPARVLEQLFGRGQMKAPPAIGPARTCLRTNKVQEGN